MKIYISGPMTGMPEYNFPAFHSAAAFLRKRGYEVVNPAELKDFIDPTVPRSHYLRGDLKALLECDAIFMLTGWKRSSGARLEHKIAVQLDMFFLFEEQGTELF